VQFEFRETVDLEIVRHRLKGDRRDGVAENILRPVHFGGGRHRQLGSRQPEIAGLVRAKHQSVGSEAYRLAIAIGCLMMDPESDQWKLQLADIVFATERRGILSAATHEHCVSDDLKGASFVPC
jgi:hypothetical protein